MSDCSICYEAVIDYPAPEGAEATGSHRSSCGHLFHPKCISKWHLSQQESTCPMCRKKATELEDCAPEEEDEEGDEEEDEEEGDGYVGGTIRITWIGMNDLIYSEGGHGVSADVEEDVGFDENREAVITRYDFERILRQQGIGPFSDARWLHLQSIYPAGDENNEEENGFDEGGTVRITRVGMDYVMRQHGGLGVLAGVEAEVGFDEYGRATITRYEFQRIMIEQGCSPLSDAQWQQLQSIYPSDDEDDNEVVAGAMALAAAPQLTFAPSADEEADPTQRARELLANPAPPASIVTPEDMEAWALVLDSARATIARHPSLRYHSRHHPCPVQFFAGGDIPPDYGVAASVACDICTAQQITIPFYHCPECQFDVCTTCFLSTASPVEEVVHAPGPFDIVDGQEDDQGKWVNLNRQAVQDLLQDHGSMATAIEFFNEEGEPPSEQTIMITMTLQSLNNRFASLGARPVTLAETLAAEARCAAVTTPPPSPTQENSLERSAAVALVSMAENDTTSLQITAFADGTREVTVKPRVILNPEDE